jgi:Uma2 family endonuclease
MEAVKPEKSIPSRLKSPIERYLDRESKSDKKHEFLNGKIRKMPGSSYNHNKIAANFIISIGQLINEKKLPFEVISSDQKIYIPQLHQILYPDALVVYQKPEFWNQRKDVLLNPILIVEILSPSTEAYDRTTKFMSYKHIPSFKEYVMVNQDKKGIETWYREEEHLWRETVYLEEDASLELKSVGLNIDIEKIYRNIEF